MCVVGFDEFGYLLVFIGVEIVVVNVCYLNFVIVYGVLGGLFGYIWFGF